MAEEFKLVVAGVPELLASCVAVLENGRPETCFGIEYKIGASVPRNNKHIIMKFINKQDVDLLVVQLQQHLIQKLAQAKEIENKDWLAQLVEALIQTTGLQASE